MPIRKQSMYHIVHLSFIDLERGGFGEVLPEVMKNKNYIMINKNYKNIKCAFVLCVFGRSEPLQLLEPCSLFLNNHQSFHSGIELTELAKLKVDLGTVFMVRLPGIQ
jgi:hypothetical protein